MKSPREKFPFVVILKNRNRKYFNFLGLFLSLASIVLFIREIFFTARIHLVFIIGVIFVLGVIIHNLVRSKNNNKVYYSKALLIASLVWLKMPYGQWLFVLFVILGLLERQAKSSTEIGFDEDRIVFNHLFKKQFSWNQLSNVILKDSILTIDFRDNHLVQHEVDDEEDEDDATEEEFNLFCRRMLEKEKQAN